MGVMNTMNFLEKLNYLMQENGLNKHSLSKACGIPYTTIDGWYKKGYDGLKLSTVKKLASFFGTTLDFWANDSISSQPEISPQKKRILNILDTLNEEQQKAVLAFVELLSKNQL